MLHLEEESVGVETEMNNNDWRCIGRLLTNGLILTFFGCCC